MLSTLVSSGTTGGHAHALQRNPSPPGHRRHPPFRGRIAMAPAALEGFERAMEDRHDVRLLAWIDRPDAWVVHVACATERARAALRDARV